MIKNKEKYLSIVAIVGGVLAYIMMCVPVLTKFGGSANGWKVLESGFQVTGQMIEISGAFLSLFLTAVLLVIALVAAAMMIAFGIVGLVTNYNKVTKANLILAIIGTVVSALAIVFVVTMGEIFGVGIGLIFIVVAFVAYFLAMIAIRLSNPKQKK